MYKENKKNRNFEKVTTSSLKRQYETKLYECHIDPDAIFSFN